MGKSRRLGIVLAGVLILLIAPPLAYRFWWYPQTLRGRFDRVRIGMREEQVKGILGEPGYFCLKEWPKSSTNWGEVRCLENGQVQWFYNRLIPDLIIGPDGSPYGTAPLEWAFNRERIVIGFGEQRRVHIKIWATHEKQLPLWIHVKRWLLLP